MASRWVVIEYQEDPGIMVWPKAYASVAEVITAVERLPRGGPCMIRGRGDMQSEIRLLNKEWPFFKLHLVNMDP